MTKTRKEIAQFEQQWQDKALPPKTISYTSIHSIPLSSIFTSASTTCGCCFTRLEAMGAADAGQKQCGDRFGTVSDTNCLSRIAHFTGFIGTRRQRASNGASEVTGACTEQIYRKPNTQILGSFRIRSSIAMHL